MTMKYTFETEDQFEAKECIQAPDMLTAIDAFKERLKAVVNGDESMTFDDIKDENISMAAARWCLRELEVCLNAEGVDAVV